MNILNKKFIAYLTGICVLVGGSTYFIFSPVTDIEFFSQTPAGWIRFTGEEKFRICFPLEPQKSEKELAATTSRIQIPYFEYKSVSDEGVSFAISYVQLPLKWRIYRAQTILKAAFDLIPENGPVAKVSSKQESTYKKYPAYNFHIQEGSTETKGRLILISGILYKLTVSSSSIPLEDSQVTAFLDSFQGRVS